jgi:sulfite reductase (NADPH) flavoprotein alpha-component
LDRIVLTQKGESDTVYSNNVDFLAVLDETLIKSHSILKHAKRGSPVLIVTPWTEEELLSNLPSETVRLIHDLGVQIYTFDAAGLAAELVGAPGPAQNTLQNALLYLVLLRFYLGKAAKEQAIEQIAQTSALGGVLKEIGLAKVNGRAWAGLAKITIPPLGTL